MEKYKIKTELLSIQGLRVHFDLKRQGILRAIDGVDMYIRQGEVLGLVGESGCGKTVLSLSLLRLISPPGYISSGQIVWEGTNLLNLSNKEMRHVRGKEIAMIFQNPQSSLNPLYSIGTQLMSVIRLHQKMSKEQAKTEALRLLRLVEIPDHERRMNEYPHQFSGGMAQRIMIAMALSCQPKLLICDEPTSSLDVTIQNQILDLLLEIREKFHMAILLVSHDLGVIAKMCDRVAVMYLGRIVEIAPAKKLYESPLHPYTQALLKSIPLPDPKHNGKITKLEGEVPSPLNIPSGCRFRTRCPKAFDLCPQIDPMLFFSFNGNDHLVACLLYHSTNTDE
ncbi:MAG: ABC transporter ATP-binding protein [Planctomycetia bacterium]|nr:ABC transporter ATP-binding protein [Planctomycetia bacterium]